MCPTVMLAQSLVPGNMICGMHRWIIFARMGTDEQLLSLTHLFSFQILWKHELCFSFLICKMGLSMIPTS